MTQPKHRYLIEVFWSDEDGGYMAIAPDLPGCNAFGDTPTEAIQEMEDAVASWLQAWVSLGRSLPVPTAMPQQAA